MKKTGKRIIGIVVLLLIVVLLQGSMANILVCDDDREIVDAIDTF